MRPRECIFALIIHLVTAPALADTPLPPLIGEDRVLIPAESPYLAESTVTVISGATLTVEAGVVVRFESAAGLHVEGRLLCEGSEAAPVQFVPAPGGESWQVLSFFHGHPRSELRHAIIDGATGSAEHWRDAAVGSMRTDLIVEHVTIQNSGNGIRTYDADIEIRHCLFGGDNDGEHINNQLGTTIIEDCELVGGGPGFDSIDLDLVADALIRDCRIVDSPDEGIDMNGSVARVEDCFIANCAEKGITAGEETQLTAERNILVDCLYGIGVSENSNGTLDHNSFYGNRFAVIVYERIVGWGGARAEISNSILAGSVVQALVVDELSEAEVTYTLCDTEALAGTGNLFDDPLFMDPAAWDFQLRADSPCIDAGDPDFPPDPDGTRSDMGALYRHQNTSAPDAPWIGSGLRIRPAPNPSRAEITFNLHLPSDASAELRIFDVLGRQVGGFRIEASSAGWQRRSWSGRDSAGRRLSAGLYIAELKQGSARSTSKLVILD